MDMLDGLREMTKRVHAMQEWREGEVRAECLYAGRGSEGVQYYLRTPVIEQWLAYPPRLAVELGSCVGGEAHGWAWKPYGWFDPAPRPRDIIHTYIYGRRPHLAHPVRG